MSWYFLADIKGDAVVVGPFTDVDQANENAEELTRDRRGVSVLLPPWEHRAA